MLGCGYPLILTFGKGRSESMKPHNVLMGLLVCLCATGCATDYPRGYSEREVQPVLDEFGVSSIVLRPKSALRDLPASGDNGFPILLPGYPCIHVALDRDYWVLMATNPERQMDVVAYMLNPKDEQSALVISIGEDIFDRPDADLEKEPGFTKITRESGIIADEKITWRRWADENHLYSDCSVRLPAKNDATNKRHLVKLGVTANTIERRKALEYHLASIQLIFPMSATTQE